MRNIPKIFDKGKGGGKPVPCYDLDGFNAAYGISQNILENTIEKELKISKLVNQIHEISHIVHYQFFSNNLTICEGFAEALPLFALNLEEIFDEHRNAIVELNANQIYSVQELLNSEKDGTYGAKEILPNKSCSFRASYISSYLFVRGCLETIVNIYNCNKAQAIQYFLEIIRKSNNKNELLIIDIANYLNFPKEELLNGKQLQIKTLNSLKSKKIMYK